ncbi:MAG: Unknown protein [uncultured Aureispira sp.]|uniref:YfhO family protein n=1 Tax=uncultured Aureispira sp. TaxID=1331704 RepID=A0A6S6ULJ7_9BACT|nr:MAG: Unknown protein [uncultured Aureispira sp.]
MAKKKEEILKKTEQTASKNLLIQCGKHLAAYLVLLVVTMLYLKPVAFEGMSLQQHDNVQAVYQQKEILDYQKKDGKVIRWTNHMFGGMPTALMRGNNSNYVGLNLGRVVTVFTQKTELRTLFLIMLCAYIGLMLLEVNFFLSIALAIILGFFTSNSLYIAAGHTGKMDVLAITPMIVGAFIYAYRKNLLLGTTIFTIGLSYSIMRNHVQMTYYTYFALTIIGLFFLIESIQKQTLPKFGKFATSMILATLLAVMSNVGALWPTYEYGQASTRGKSELIKKADQSPNATKNAASGLGYEYVFGLSMEKAEVMTLAFPNFYGGTQAKSFYSNMESETYAAFNDPSIQREIIAAAKKNGIADGSQFLNQLINQYTRHYRGSQTMSGGPMYYGVVVCFLLFLALLLLRGTIKWAFVSTFAFLTILAWGKHFAIFNDLMYYYFPLYSKFRDTKMTLLVAQPIAILAIGLGLMELVNFNAEKYKNTLSAKLLPSIKQTVSRQGYVLLAGVIFLGFCGLTYLYISMGTLSSPKDDELAMISPRLIAALEADRAALAKADILKGMGFVLATMVALSLYAKQIIKIEIAAVILALLAMLDLNIVNKDYLNKDSYTKVGYLEKTNQQVVQKSDRDVLKDQSIYKVVDYSRGAPSQTAATSGLHKSLGGYSAAKPLLYQEFWNYYQLDNGNVALKQHSNLMNMMNVKYILISPERFMDNPTALGNAWFIQNIKQVKNANEELAALDALDPVLNAVVQEKYADYVSGLNTAYQAGDKIYLESYHPDTMTYQSETSKDRFAVFSEMYYPTGWNVYIDGEQVDDFIKTNYILRGLKVPKGKHKIQMIYEPQSILLGSKLGGFATILILLLIGSSIYYSTKK